MGIDPMAFLAVRQSDGSWYIASEEIELPRTDCLGGRYAFHGLVEPERGPMFTLGGLWSPAKDGFLFGTSPDLVNWSPDNDLCRGYGSCAMCKSAAEYVSSLTDVLEKLLPRGCEGIDEEDMREFWRYAEFGYSGFGALGLRALHLSLGVSQLERQDVTGSFRPVAGASDGTFAVQSDEGIDVDGLDIVLSQPVVQLRVWLAGGRRYRPAGDSDSEHDGIMAEMQSRQPFLELQNVQDGNVWIEIKKASVFAIVLDVVAQGSGVKAGKGKARRSSKPSALGPVQIWSPLREVRQKIDPWAGQQTWFLTVLLSLRRLALPDAAVHLILRMARPSALQREVALGLMHDQWWGFPSAHADTGTSSAEAVVSLPLVQFDEDEFLKAAKVAQERFNCPLVLPRWIDI
mmetsp:Transcript_48843/g.116124  ORF Transcript_48843/g.116124 Transcript_48843/m.116124 type:complete len:402 (-) Transcript_48843:134-1339(-)